MTGSQRRSHDDEPTRGEELARFQVVGRDSDRGLIRKLARQLAENTAEAAKLRAVVTRSVAGESPSKGGILAALRRSPLVDADLDLRRPPESGRAVDL